MRLASFPYLVQKEVLDHLSLNHTFFLSLCSKKTEDFILQTQRKQFEKVEDVVYFINGQIMVIDFQTVFSSSYKTFMILLRSPADYTELMFECKDGGPVEEVRVDELGIPIDFFRWPAKQTDLHVKFSPAGNVESIIETIHDHLYNLLGHHTMFELKSSSQAGHVLPMLRNIHILNIRQTEFESAKLDELLSLSPRLEYLKWIASKDQKMELRESSKIFELDTVSMSTDLQLSTDLMKHFHGRHVFVDEPHIETTDVIRFLNTWRTGEKFQKLEVIGLATRKYFDILKIWTAVKFKVVATNVEYSYIRRFQISGYPIFRNLSWEFKSHLYLVRKSDGRVASLMLTLRRIILGVWDMNETQFLEQFT